MGMEGKPTFAYVSFDARAVFRDQTALWWGAVFSVLTANPSSASGLLQTPALEPLPIWWARQGDNCREEAEQRTVSRVSEAGGAQWDPRQVPGSLGRRGGQITTLQKGPDIIRKGVQVGDPAVSETAGVFRTGVEGGRSRQDEVTSCPPLLGTKGVSVLQPRTRGRRRVT